jgi:hypothetical protein
MIVASRLSHDVCRRHYFGTFFFSFFLVRGSFFLHNEGRSPSREEKNLVSTTRSPYWSPSSFYYWHFFVLMPFWLVYMEIYSADFLTPSFLIRISKHHRYHH